MHTYMHMSYVHMHLHTWYILIHTYIHTYIYIYIYKGDETILNLYSRWESNLDRYKNAKVVFPFYDVNLIRVLEGVKATDRALIQSQPATQLNKVTVRETLIDENSSSDLNNAVDLAERTSSMMAIGQSSSTSTYSQRTNESQSSTQLQRNSILLKRPSNVQNTVANAEVCLRW